MPPFQGDTRKKTIEKILKGPIILPAYLTQDASNLIRSLLKRSVSVRLGTAQGARAIKTHPFFKYINWDDILAKKIPPPMADGTQRKKEDDLSNFDKRFTKQTPIDSPDDSFLSESANQIFKGFTYVAPSVMEAIGLPSLKHHNIKPRKQIRVIHNDPSEIEIDQSPMTPDNYPPPPQPPRNFLPSPLSPGPSQLGYQHHNQPHYHHPPQLLQNPTRTRGIPPGSTREAYYLNNHIDSAHPRVLDHFRPYNLRREAVQPHTIDMESDNNTRTEDMMCIDRNLSRMDVSNDLPPV